MSGRNNPEPKEWWNNDLYGRVFIEAVSELDICLRYNEHRLVVLARKSFSGRHLPECDSWTWQPPDWVTQDRVPARPGIDQRRWVKNGEGLGKANDWMDCDSTVRSFGEQVKHGFISGGNTLELRCLRKDLPPVQEVWPKYYETTVPGELAFLRRDTATGATYVLTDGKEGGAIVWGCADEWRKELTESEALARIQKPAEPQPEQLRIYMTVDGILYCDTKPRTPLHKQIQFSSCGCFVVEVAE